MTENQTFEWNLQSSSLYSALTSQSSRIFAIKQICEPPNFSFASHLSATSFWTFSKGSIQGFMDESAHDLHLLTFYSCCLDL